MFIYRNVSDKNNYDLIWQINVPAHPGKPLCNGSLKVALSSAPSWVHWRRC